MTPMMREPNDLIDYLKENDELIYKLKQENEQLKQEKEEMKQKTKTILDFYSKRYAESVFNSGRHSKQLRSELWIVKQILCELGLYDDGDVE